MFYYFLPIAHFIFVFHLYLPTIQPNSFVQSLVRWFNGTLGRWLVGPLVRILVLSFANSIVRSFKVFVNAILSFLFLFCPTPTSNIILCSHLFFSTSSSHSFPFKTLFYFASSVTTFTKVSSSFLAEEIVFVHGPLPVFHIYNTKNIKQKTNFKIVVCWTTSSQ